MERGHLRAKSAAHAAAADVCVICSGRRFLAHADILRESPVLAEMLDGGEAMLTRAAANGAGARLRLLTLSAEPGAADGLIADALTADGCAQVLELIYNPLRPLARVAGAGGGLKFALEERDALELIPAAHFLNIPALLALGDAALAARLAGELSWDDPADWSAAGDDTVPRDQQHMEFGQRYSLPRTTALALASIARNLACSCRCAAGVAARVLAAASEPARTILLEELVAHMWARRRTLEISGGMLPGLPSNGSKTQRIHGGARSIAV